MRNFKGIFLYNGFRRTGPLYAFLYALPSHCSSMIWFRSELHQEGLTTAWFYTIYCLSLKSNELSVNEPWKTGDSFLTHAMRFHPLECSSKQVVFIRGGDQSNSFTKICYRKLHPFLVVISYWYPNAKILKAIVKVVVHQRSTRIMSALKFYRPIVAFERF